MTDEEAFRAAIDAEPGDLLARLAFADWLDDRGREAEAELVRLLCQGNGWLTPVQSVINWFHRHHNWPVLHPDVWVWFARQVGGFPPRRQAAATADVSAGPWRTPRSVARLAWAWLDLPPQGVAAEVVPPPAPWPDPPPVVVTRLERTQTSLALGLLFGLTVLAGGWFMSVKAASAGFGQHAWTVSLTVGFALAAAAFGFVGGWRNAGKDGW